MQDDIEEYRAFRDGKHDVVEHTGFATDCATFSPVLFPHQVDTAGFLCEAGRGAGFLDTGLGKTRIMGTWAEQVVRRTDGRALIVAPLAVAHQTIRECAAIGLDVAYIQAQEQIDDHPHRRVFITNYDRLKSFDGSAWDGVALDESDILANYTGKTKQRLLAMFAHTRYKTVYTATPAPNDLLELGNQAAFLGICGSHEMISKYFINDTMQAGKYRLMGHAEEKFYEWLASWAVCISRPSDLGYDDDGYNLPPLHISQHAVAVDHSRAWETVGRDGQRPLFLNARRSATGIWSEKHATLADRCRLAAELVTATSGECWVAWAETDEESALLAKRIPGAVEVRGSEKLEVKERKLRAFSDGQIAVLVTKPPIAGLGLNWQHAHHMAFVSMTFSFKKFYQALRRMWRYRQTHPVIAHVITAETEENILSAIQSKHEQHQELQRNLIAAMKRTGLLAKAGEGLLDYNPRTPMSLPPWVYNRAA